MNVVSNTRKERIYSVPVNFSIAFLSDFSKIFFVSVYSSRVSVPDPTIVDSFGLASRVRLMVAEKLSLGILAFFNLWYTSSETAIVFAIRNYIILYSYRYIFVAKID